MKTITIIIVLVSVGLIYGQSISDSTQLKQRNQEREKVQTQTQNQEMNKVQNQIGSKEKGQTDLKQNRKRKDVFIDKDGDGICDTRQSGMSFNKMRKRLGAGKQGPSGKGSGGNQNGNGSSGGN
jgi:uncharacterized protein YpmB